MTTRAAEISPLVYARTAGILFLILLVCGPFSMTYLPSVLVVPGDATATASNIVASEPLFRLGLISDSIVFLSEIVLTVVLYVLLKPVSKTLSMVAASARLAMTVVQGVNLLGNLTVLLLLSGDAYLEAFGPDQLHALVLLVLNAHADGVHIWVAFFSLHCLVLGWLVYNSGYFPRVLGTFLMFAALGYMVNSFGSFLFPDHQAVFGVVVAVTAVVGEFPFFFWLLIKGVDVQKWDELAP